MREPTSRRSPPRSFFCVGPIDCLRHTPNLDWEMFLAAHPPRHRIAILVLVEGGTMREAGKRCGLKDSAALSLKRRIGQDLIEFFGEDVIRRLLDGTRPGWESDLRMSRERHLCQVTTARAAAMPAAC